MSDSKRIVGSSGVRKDKNTGTYTIQYYLLESELADYVPKVGDVAGWTPEAAYVSGVEKNELAPGYYILAIEAEPDENAGILGNAGNKITDRYEWKYEDRELYYPPKLWGVRRATKTDVAAGALNIYGNTAVEKDFIYKNYASDEELLGSAGYAESPFKAASHPPINLIGTKREWRHFIVVFYSEKSPKYLHRFHGVNGSFPAALEVYNGGVSGKWRLLRQELESYTNDGKEYVKVTRTFGYAWGALWDPVKCGGTWANWELGGTQED
ncbi:MAG: hypothetical protein PHV82_13665 [Victivallaceae bacterium]|nr:hypothetical protein [Victivallaceae bacterium]